MLKKTIFLLGLFFSCCACAKINYNDPHDIAKNTTVTHDNFKKESIYAGPNLWQFYDGYHSMYSIMMLMKDDSDSPIFCIHVETGMSRGLTAPRFTEYYDTDGEKLTIMRDINIKNGSLVEFSNIELGARYILKHVNTGLKFKLYGDRKSAEMFIPGAYFKAMLGVWDQYRPSKKK